MRLASPAAVTRRAGDRRVVLLVALMPLIMLAVVAPSSARAAGDTTHTFMADEAIAHVKSSKLRRLLTANRVALLSGGAYPDSGYYVDDRPGGDFGEISHWERFINAYVRYIRAKSCGPLAEPRGPCASLIAHMMGAAAHGIGDEMWDWLFEPLVTDHGERHQSIEFAMDMIAIADFSLPVFTPYLPPPEELLAIYRSISRPDITREGILAGHAATVGVLDIERRIAPGASEQIRRQMPWSAAHMYSESGGVRDVAEAAAEYYEALWRKLRAREGRHPRPRVTAIHPEFGERGVPYRWQPPRTSPGPHTGGGEQRIIAVLSNSLDAASVNAQSFRLIDADNRPVPALAGYPRAGPYGTDDGTHSMLFYPATDLRPCSRYRAVVTTRIRDHAGATLRRRFAWPFLTRPVTDSSGAPPGRCGVRGASD
jgi:Bacterial Ig-like domain